MTRGRVGRGQLSRATLRCRSSRQARGVSLAGMTPGEVGATAVLQAVDHLVATAVLATAVADVDCGPLLRRQLGLFRDIQAEMIRDMRSGSTEGIDRLWDLLHPTRPSTAPDKNQEAHS